MNTIISMLLLFVYNSLNKDVYYDIAVYILDHLDEMESISIENIAHNCHTSTITIKKFYNLLGIESFKKFKTLLNDTRVGRLEQIKFRYSQINEEEIFEQVKILSHNKLLRKEVFMSDIEKVVDFIYDAKRTYINGAIFPLALTLNFVEDMKIFGKPFYIEQLNYKYNMNDYNEDDLLFIITITGRYLMQNKQSFLKMYESSAKKVILTQNSIFQTFYVFDCMIPLYGSDDSETENLIVIEILNLIKYRYFMKYINKGEKV